MNVTLNKARRALFSRRSGEPDHGPGTEPLGHGERPRPVRVLSIDGGGIRGILPAMVLADIERRTGKPIWQLFDLIAGTSTGALMALALSTPGPDDGALHTARDLVRLYEVEGKRVFSRSVWHKVRAVGNLVDGKYPASGMEGVLEECFGEARLRDSLTETLATAYEIERRMPFIFKSCNARAKPHYDFPMKQVVRAATAAPTYFEPAKIEIDGPADYYALVDGAVFAYNPGMCAYVHAMERFPDAQEFLMVSLGTGEHTRRLGYEDVKDWGAARWAQPVFSVMCDGQATSVNHQLQQLLPPAAHGRKQYYRFQARLEVGNDDMDDASNGNIRILKLLAEDMLQANRSQLRTLCEHLVEYAEADPFDAPVLDSVEA